MALKRRSVSIRDICIEVNDDKLMVLVTKKLQEAAQRLEGEVNSRANFSINGALYVNTYLSCLIKQGAVSFAIFHNDTATLTRRLTQDDMSLKYFEKALDDLVEEAMERCSVLERGGRIPQNDKVIRMWNILTQYQLESITLDDLAEYGERPRIQRPESLDEQIAQAKAQIESERAEPEARPNKNRGIDISDG